jgi:hypothetical protein
MYNNAAVLLIYYIHNTAVVLKKNVLQRNSPPNILQNTAVVFQKYVLQRSSPQDILQKQSPVENSYCFAEVLMIYHRKNYWRLKGTVARDCRPLVFFNNRPQTGP